MLKKVLSFLLVLTMCASLLIGANSISVAAGEGEPELLSLNMPSTAKSYQTDGGNNWPASGGNDGDTTNKRWVASSRFFDDSGKAWGGAEWWQVDLKDVCELTRVDITWLAKVTGAEYRSYKYYIEVSDTGLDGTYTEVYDARDNTTHDFTEAVLPTGTSGRYVKVTVTGYNKAGSGDNWGRAGFYECSVYGYPNNSNQLALEAVNGAETAEDMLILIDQYQTVLELEDELYLLYNLDDPMPVIESIFAGKPYVDKEALELAFNKAYNIQALNSAADAARFRTIFESVETNNLNLATDANYVNYYSLLDENEKAEIIKELYDNKPYKSSSLLKSKLGEIVALRELGEQGNIIVHETFESKPAFASETTEIVDGTLYVPVGGTFSDIKVPKNVSIEFDISSEAFNGIQVQLRKPYAGKINNQGFFFNYAEYSKIGWSTEAGYSGVRIAKNDSNGDYYPGNPFSTADAKKGNNKYALAHPERGIVHHVKFVTFENKLIIYFDYEKVYEIAEDAYNNGSQNYYLSMYSLMGSGTVNVDGLGFNLDNLVIKKVNKADLADVADDILVSDDYSSGLPYYAYGKAISLTTNPLEPENNVLKMYDEWGRTADIATSKDFSVELDLGYSGPISTNGFRFDVRKTYADAIGTKLYRVYYKPDVEAGTASYKIALATGTNTTGTYEESTEEVTEIESSADLAFFDALSTVHIKVEVIGDKITVYHDGNKVIEHTILDDDCLDSTKKFRMGFASRSANQYASSKPYLTVDNLLIKSIEKTPALWLDEASFYAADGNIILNSSDLVAGTYTLKTYAYSDLDDTFTGTAYLALFNGDKLARVISAPISIAAGSDGDEVTASITLTDEDLVDSNYSIEGFIWDSNMMPVKGTARVSK